MLCGFIFAPGLGQSCSFGRIVMQKGGFLLVWDNERLVVQGVGEFSFLHDGDYNKTVGQWVVSLFHGASINLLALTCSTCISISLFLKWLLLFYISLLLHSSFSSFAYGPFVLGYF